MITTWKKELLLLFLIFYLSLSIDIEDSEISYLENYGYIAVDNTVAALRTDDFYSEKIMEFQEMMALPLTGVMDTATKNMMKAPRCGLRDKDKRRGKRDLPRDVPRWRKRALTYWVKNAPISALNYAEVQKEIKKAFKAWEEVTGLTIEEKESSNEMDVDIAISFEPREHGDNIPFRAHELAHAFFPPNGDIHFNNDHIFRVNPAFYEDINLLNVAIHQVGHSLGVNHINKRDSVMFPTNTYSPTRLSPEDIDAIQALYGEKAAYTDTEDEDPDRPDPCDGRRIDAAVTIGEEVYLFKNKWLWTFRGGRLHIHPRLVSSYWPEITGNIDSALSYDGYQNFFVGDEVYIYKDRVFWGTRKLTVYGIPSEVKKIRVAFAWNNGASTKFHLWAADTEYVYDPVLNMTEAMPIHWTLDRATANLVVHGDNYIFTNQGVHKGNTATFTYDDPIPFSEFFHCEDTGFFNRKPETSTTTTSTTTTTTTTTAALWTQKVVVLRDPTAMVRYDSSPKLFAKKANTKWFRNYIVSEITELERVSERGENDALAYFHCDRGELACICDDMYNCVKLSRTISFSIRVVCVQRGNCSVHAHENIMLVSWNAHYISCGKCANEIELDTSPPFACLPSLEDHEKSTPIGVCAVNQQDVVNKLQVDYAIGYVRAFEDKGRISCRYPQGEIFYYNKRRPDSFALSLSFAVVNGCLKTKNGTFYSAEKKFFIYHYCDKNGECTLLAAGGIVTAVNSGKTYTEAEQKYLDDTNKPYDDTDAYLHDIVSIADGTCPQRVCPK